MTEVKTNTSIYMWGFYSNWTAQDKEIFKGAKFDNYYLGDMQYKHYNFMLDFDVFLQDNYMFALLSEKENNHYEDIIELLQQCKHFITSYDVTDYAFNSEQDEIVTLDCRKTMFVFKVSGKHEQALKHFKQSQFSKMYDFDAAKSLFSNHTDYFVKLMRGNTYIKIDSKNVEEVFSKLSLEKEVNNIKISYFHVLNKSAELKNIIEKIYNINLPKDAELKSKLDWNKEIYNYTTVMNQDLVSIS
jgi:hypothetical protein